MKKSLYLFTVLFFFVNISTLYAQQGFSITSADLTNNIGSISYSIGLLRYQNYSNSELLISDGVQQPFEIQSSFKFEESKSEIELYCKVFPNPSSDFVHLTIENYVLEDVLYILTDQIGQTKRSGKIINNKTTFNISGLPSGMYLLKIWTKNTKITTYKILKK